ncbi:MAG: hypothetical protein LUQ25_05960, partial [Methanoregulaceae archaeon]|nr:hypothetical protein [Methanoregulaceae archaeon]
MSPAYEALLFVLIAGLIAASGAAAVPVAQFTASPESGNAPLNVTFTDTSTGSPTIWSWYFGDEKYSEKSWVRKTAAANWTARSGHASVLLPDGSIVLMGGRHNTGTGTLYFNDTWRSTDAGGTWTCVNASSGWSARSGLTAVAFQDGNIVVAGGNSDGTMMSDVWRSTDHGVTWTRVNSTPGWSPRHRASGVVLPDGNLTLMCGSSGADYMKDTWRSTDQGATWTLLGENLHDLGWSRDSQSALVTREGSIVISGGYNPVPGALWDVWISSNGGVNWSEQTENFPDTTGDYLYAHTSHALPDGSLVAIGGRRNFQNFVNSMWRSTDNGGTWTVIQDQSAGWDARKYHSSVMFPDGRIVLMGGESSTSDRNDVWILETASSRVQNPTHTYTVAGIWRVTFQAGNSEGYANSTRIIPVRQSVSFTGSQTNVKRLEVNFSGASTGGATGWSWYFGDENYTTRNWVQVSPDDFSGDKWIPRSLFPGLVLPNGRIVVAGGFSSDAGYLNDVWLSKDRGVTWKCAAEEAAWPPRADHAGVVLPDGSIVIMGGFRDIQIYNDVWQSTDAGVTWTCVNASPGWAARSGFPAVVLPDGSIVIMGGSDYWGNRFNDVWMSTDAGSTWTCVNASPGWAARSGFPAVVLPDGSIVIMGGYGVSQAYNDVWRSTDAGSTWTRVRSDAGWELRGYHSAVVLPDGSIVLM